MIDHMVVLKAHFDGKVFVPDEPVALPPNQRVRVIVEPADRRQIDLEWLCGVGATPGTKPYDPSEADALWEKGYLPGTPGHTATEGE
jgi:hypothetical protein